MSGVLLLWYYLPVEQRPCSRHIAEVFEAYCDVRPKLVWWDQPGPKNGRGTRWLCSFLGSMLDIK